MEIQSQVLRDGVNFENKLSSIKERLDAYAKQKSNEETKKPATAVGEDGNRMAYQSYNSTRRNDDDDDKADVLSESTNGKVPGFSIQRNVPTSPISPKMGLNLNIVKPLRGGRSYFDEDGCF